jgi:hypothetical protein
MPTHTENVHVCMDYIIHIRSYIHTHTYRVKHDEISKLRLLIAEVIPSQQLHMNIGPILSGYGAVDV